MYLFLHVWAVGWLVGYDEELQVSWVFLWRFVS